MASSSNSKPGEDFKKKKALDEARKAGTAEPERDEEGNEINPHIPSWMASAPWYLDASAKPSLKHQRLRDGVQAGAAQTIGGEWYSRGATLGPAATKFRKGACANCGAMTHKTNECTERPRAKGAKHTNQGIAADEVVQDVSLGWDGKRDRWNGYNADSHAQVMQRFEALEGQRREERQKAIEEKLSTGVVPEGLEEDDEKDNIGDATIGQHFDAKNRQSVRNLRIREDTAKFLFNLDPNSAHYDPRTRAMRANPLQGEDPQQAEFAGDNFIRYTGDVKQFSESQLYEITAQEIGSDIHMNALPTLTAKAYGEFKARKESADASKIDILYAKYGGEQHSANALPSGMLLGQSESYVEYSADGSVLKGAEAAIPRSKYDEDVMRFNHTCVWGSWWDREGRIWGYACCLSTNRNTYCVGKKAQNAAAAMTEIMKTQVELALKNRSAPVLAQVVEAPSAPAAAVERSKAEKLQDAMEMEGKRRAQQIHDDRKRKFNSVDADAKEVTEEEMEAYRMHNQRSFDPMAAYLGGGDEDVPVKPKDKKDKSGSKHSRH